MECGVGSCGDGQSGSSIRKPTFIETWKCAIRPSAMWPRMLLTSIQSRLRSVLWARATPFCIASVTPALDVPVNSMMRYVESLTERLLGGGWVGSQLAAGGLDDVSRHFLGVVVVPVDDVLGRVHVAAAVRVEERGVVVDLDHVLPVAAVQRAGRDRRDPEPPVE